MRRVIYTIVMIGLLALIPTAAFAQEATEEPPPEPLSTTTSAIPGNVLPVLINARTDLEILVNSQLGSERPLGWSGSLDINDPQLALLIRLDLELLVARLYGVDGRPEGWFGAVPSTSAAIARDIRHDLELLADFAVQPGVRPPGWAGDRPIMRCDRATQNLVQLLERSAQFVLTAEPLSQDYCQQAATQASQFTESQLLGSGGTAQGQPGVAGIAPADSVRANGNATLAFLDRNARASVGVIPTTEAFLPLARSYTQFSNMILVRGNDFEVFVDYTTTTLSKAQFTALGDVNSFAANPACLAPWCNAAG